MDYADKLPPMPVVHFYAAAPVHDLAAVDIEPELSRIVQARYLTGDPELDQLVETSCKKFLNPDASIRRESLEGLWDAWERVKTFDGNTKKLGISKLLNQVSGSSTYQFRTTLESEARALTDIGNTFRIRHSETD